MSTKWIMKSIDSEKKSFKKKSNEVFGVPNFQIKLM
jgi:hypothetical protein